MSPVVKHERFNFMTDTATLLVVPGKWVRDGTVERRCSVEWAGIMERYRACS